MAIANDARALSSEDCDDPLVVAAAALTVAYHLEKIRTAEADVGQRMEAEWWCPFGINSVHVHRVTDKICRLYE